MWRFLGKMNRNISRGMIVLTFVLLLTGCSNKETKKDTFVGIWITWDESQQFKIDEYIEKKFIKEEDVSIKYLPKENGLFVLNYINYNGSEIEDRITIASKELEVENTIYNAEEIYNHVTIVRGHTLPQNLDFYRINEKTNGEIYVDYSSKDEYFSRFGVEQLKKIYRDGYRIEVDFKDVDVISNVLVSEYSLEGNIINEYSFDYSNVQNEYTVLEETSYVILTENYTDIDGKEYTENEYLIFNNNILENQYDSYLVEDGVGRFENIKFCK